MLGEILGYLSGVQGRTWTKMIDLVAFTAMSQGEIIQEFTVPYAPIP